MPTFRVSYSRGRAPTPPLNNAETFVESSFPDGFVARAETPLPCGSTAEYLRVHCLLLLDEALRHNLHVLQREEEDPHQQQKRSAEFCRSTEVKIRATYKLLQRSLHSLTLDQHHDMFKLELSLRRTIQAFASFSPFVWGFQLPEHFVPTFNIRHYFEEVPAHSSQFVIAVVSWKSVEAVMAARKNKGQLCCGADLDASQIIVEDILV